MIGDVTLQSHQDLPASAVHQPMMVSILLSDMSHSVGYNQQGKVTAITLPGRQLQLRRFPLHTLLWPLLGR